MAKFWEDFKFGLAFGLGFALVNALIQALVWFLSHARPL